MRLLLTCILALGVFAGGCSDDGGDPDGGVDGDGGIGDLKGDCAPGTRVGRFTIDHALEYTSVSGKVRDGVIPAEVPTLDNEAAGCKLWHTINPECDPACDPGYTCDHDGTCVAYPANKSVGSVTVDGLNKDVTLEPPSYFDTEMPHPGFDPGSPITLQAAGEDYPGFTMYGRGVTPIELTGDTWIIKEGEDLTLSWIPADDEDAFVRITLNVDMHGVSPINMVCDLEDTGTATVPAALIDEFLENGVTGFATAYIYRMTADKVDIDPGCVDFLVRSWREGSLEVDGFTPCTGEEDCPDGYTCNLEIESCVEVEES